MIEISNFQYLAKVCGGNVTNHPRFPAGHFVYTSIPVSLDVENKILKTTSGSVYKIVSFQGNGDEIMLQLSHDIEQMRIETR